MVVLDVCCGCRPLGDVNCDLFIHDLEGHRSSKGKSKAEFEINVKKIPNFVVCDARCLPFKDNAFEKVVSRDAIEHIKNAYLMFKELVRVSNSMIVVETMHHYGDRLFDRSRIAQKWNKLRHVNHFNFRSFANVERFFNCKVTREYVVSYIYMPKSNYIMPLIRIPFEIGLEFKKIG